MENPETPVRILVVDDEPDIRNILHILLSSRGYEVDEAENGLRAVELVRAQPDYDLIILDIMMPGMDGVAACTEIRQHSVAPILFLTAKAQPADMSDASACVRPQRRRRLSHQALFQPRAVPAGRFAHPALPRLPRQGRRADGHRRARDQPRQGHRVQKRPLGRDDQDGV